MYACLLLFTQLGSSCPVLQLKMVKRECRRPPLFHYPTDAAKVAIIFRQDPKLFSPTVRSLCGIAARDNRILLDLRWPSDEDLRVRETTLALAAVMLPFVRRLHSASVIYGLSCGKVIVTPLSPVATDIQSREMGQNLSAPISPLFRRTFFPRSVDRPMIVFLISIFYKLRKAD